MERAVVVSSDCHAGAPVERSRDFLERLTPLPARAAPDEPAVTVSAPARGF